MACFGVLLTGFMSTFIDPSDASIKQLKQNSVKNFHDFPKLCVSCKTRVGAYSKHCGVCNRCTAHFDHHCTWLNNCIGFNNYRWFFALICSLQCFCTAEAFAQLSLLVRILQEGVGESALMHKYAVGEEGYLFFLALLFAWLLTACCFVANGFLICFHLYLRARSMTTYEYIIASRRHRVVPLRYDVEVSNKDSPSDQKAWTPHKNTTEKSCSNDSSQLENALRFKIRQFPANLSAKEEKSQMI